MARLIDDRYFAHASGHAWDLATGEIVEADRHAAPTSSDLPPVAPLVELLQGGQDGAPSWIDVDVPPAARSQLLRRAASDAQSRGFVPVDVDLYFTLRADLQEILRERALLLMSGQGSQARVRGWMALLDAAARSPRPHVLLTFRPAQWAGAATVRETRAAYSTGHSRRMAAPPRIDSDEEHQLLRAARARVFVNAGRHAAAERLLRDVAAALVRRRRGTAACRVSMSLGRILLDRGRPHDADRVFDDAAASATASDEPSLLAGLRTWQAVARADAGRLPEAESLCRAVLSAPTLPSEYLAHARAVLARVLLWQRRVAEAAALALDLPESHELDCATAAYIAATAVRVLIAGERVFEAGLRARQLLSAVGDDDAAAGTMAALSHLRVLIAAGDLALARDGLDNTVRRAKVARLPLCAARARLIWAQGLLKAGRMTEARQEIRSLSRLSAAAPPLLRRGVAETLRAIDVPRTAAVARDSPVVDASSTVGLVKLAYDVEDDREAVRRVLEAIARTMQTSRIDICSADAGPVSTVLTAGSGLATRLGARVLDAGVSLGPECFEGGLELGVPIRRGVRVHAAIVGRWPANRAPTSNALALLELAAAVACPRVESMLAAARVAAAATTSVPELVGTSTAMADVRTAIVRAAAAPFAVLIQGESGAGKELVARAIHQLGPRRERRFCDVNCAALPDDLVESELFGHARGAFTGAVTDRSGLFEDADGGTVFLDELPNLSQRAQAKLLRVLQQHEVRRLGETFSRKVDVRLVTAANRDMNVEAESGRFRQDLLYRLDVIRIRVPPLRERSGDVALLAEHFWQQASARLGSTATLTHGVLAALSRYHWPGNVRELQNVMAALAVAAPARGSVRAQFLPAAISGAAAVTSGRLSDARMQFERRAIESALARAGGSRTRAARELGLSRQGLLKMIARLGLER